MSFHVRTAVGAAVLATGLLAGCSTSGYTFIENTDAKAYFKVPDDWQVYVVDGGGTPTDRPVATGATPSQPWTRIFDADPVPDADHVNQVGTAYPVGDVQIIPLGSSTADTLDMATLRSAVLGGSDPLQADGVEVVSYDVVNHNDGYRGLRIVFNQPMSAGGYSTVDYTAYVDPTTSYAYLFRVQCSSQCYLDHRSEIDTVVNSLSVGRGR